MNRVMIAACKSGSGKTLITCGILKALLEDGIRPASFKCGPDYIDPMFHRAVLGIASGNLDSWFTGKDMLCEILQREAADADIAVMEGVMGLYDGIGGASAKGSCYEVAALTGTPIILAVDAHGMGNSICALIRGFQLYDTAHLIKGILLNRVSGAYYERLSAVIEEETGIPVLGFLPKLGEDLLTGRHLGLVMPDETPQLSEKLSRIAAKLRENVNLKKLMEISALAKPETLRNRESVFNKEDVLNKEAVLDKEAQNSMPSQRIKIAVARDEAFCFYYRENFELFETLGAELCFFSPIHEKKLPEDVCGILLGGGYPELHLESLCGNASMREAIRSAISDNMPSLAECGGFMYLHEWIEDKGGVKYPALGILPGGAKWMNHSVRFGYMELSAGQNRPEDSLILTDSSFSEDNPAPLVSLMPEDAHLRGHEYHYFDCTENGSDLTAQKPVSNVKWNCCYVSDSHLWGFPHLYYPSDPRLLENFVRACRIYAQNK